MMDLVKEGCRASTCCAVSGRYPEITRLGRPAALRPATGIYKVMALPCSPRLALFI